MKLNFFLREVMCFVSEKNMDPFINLPTELGKLLNCVKLLGWFLREDFCRNSRQSDIIVVISLRLTVRFNGIWYQFEVLSTISVIRLYVIVAIYKISSTSFLAKYGHGPFGVLVTPLLKSLLSSLQAVS